MQKNIRSLPSSQLSWGASHPAFINILSGESVEGRKAVKNPSPDFSSHFLSLKNKNFELQGASVGYKFLKNCSRKKRVFLTLSEISHIKGKKEREVVEIIFIPKTALAFPRKKSPPLSADFHFLSSSCEESKRKSF